MAEPFRIDYAKIAEPLREIPVAIRNRIEGEKHDELKGIHPALPMVTSWTIHVAAATYKGAKQLVAEDPDDPERRSRNVVCLPPLTRAVLENLFTTVFIYDEPRDNVPWYLGSAWLDAHAECEKLVERHRGDPEYTDWLGSYRLMVEGMAKDAGLSAQQRKDPNLVRAWPLPGGMSNGQKKGGVDATQDPDRRAFLRHLRTWYYGSLSADAHFSGMGFVRRGSLLLDDLDPSVQLVRLSQTFFQLLTIYVGLLSEVVGQLRFAHEERRLRKVWEHIARWPEAADLFQARYDLWLKRAAL
jgi:hypothetical protein